MLLIYLKNADNDKYQYGEYDIGFYACSPFLSDSKSLVKVLVKVTLHHSMYITETDKIKDKLTEG